MKARDDSVERASTGLDRSDTLLGGEEVLSEPKIFAERVISLLVYLGEVLLDFIIKEMEKRAF